MELRTDVAQIYYGSLILNSWKTYLLAAVSPYVLGMPRHVLRFVACRIVNSDFFPNSESLIHSNIHTVVERSVFGQWHWQRMWRPDYGWFLVLRPLTIFYYSMSGWHMYSFSGRMNRLTMVGANETHSIRIQSSYDSTTYFRDPIAEYPWQQEVLDRLEATPPRNVVRTMLVVGPPGVGKTKLAVLFAMRTRREGRVDPIVFLGYRIKHLKGQFSSAVSTERCPFIISMDEVDISLSEKDNSNENACKAEITSFLDTPYEHRTHIATSNQPLETFPEWFVRRFDVVVAVDQDGSLKYHSP